jgi:hypothetical protein
MARQTPIQNQFTRGELSPLMSGRIDLQQYYQGAATLADCLPLPHGGASSRPGTRFVAPVGTGAKKCRVFPFVFNIEDAYTLLLEEGNIRFFRAQGQVVEEAKPIAGATQSNPVMLNIDAHGYADGDDVYITDVSGMSEINNRWFRVANAGADFFALAGENGFGHGAYGSGGSAARVHEIPAPWLEDELFEIQFVQDADTMYLVHPNHKPRVLTRSGHTDWTLSEYTPANDPFTASDDYPAAVAFFQGRIVFGYTANRPQTLWFSRSGNIDDMSEGTGDSDGFNKTLFASQANPIRWIVGGTDLIIGTTGGVWVVDRPTSSPVTVTNFSVKRRETSGVANLAPVEVDNRVLFVARRGLAANKGEKLKELHFDDSELEYIAPDLTLLSEHISQGGIVDLAWQQDAWKAVYEGAHLPAADRVLWAARADGALLSFTYNPRESIVAWARHRSSGAVESVSVMPGKLGDELWCVVRRQIDGVPRRYVEFLCPGLFMDSALEGRADTPQDQWGPLHHLEGEEVAVLADGAPVGMKTVEEGLVTLDKGASEVQIGLPFRPEIELMPLEIQLRDGTSIGGAKSVSSVVVRLLASVGVKITASKRSDGVEIPFREVSDDIARSVPPFTGDKAVPAPTSWSDATVRITQPNPLPMTVQAVVVSMEARR